jgi:pimeloyl-ACP methyl ester carboxylesterase
VSFDRPALLVHGTGDAVLPFSASEELAERSARAELVAIDTPSHMLPMTHGAELAPLIFGRD